MYRAISFYSSVLHTSKSQSAQIIKKQTDAQTFKCFYIYDMYIFLYRQEDWWGLQRSGRNNWLTLTIGFVDYTEATRKTASDKFQGRWISISSWWLNLGTDRVVLLFITLLRRTSTCSVIHLPSSSCYYGRVRCCIYYIVSQSILYCNITWIALGKESP